MKYCPEFTDRFGSIQDSRSFCQYFFNWYNKEHHHSGIGLVTPEQLHYGFAEKIHEERLNVLKEAFELNPHRFKGRLPKPPSLPDAVWINKPKPEKEC